jgi:hypothetical protein
MSEQEVIESKSDVTETKTYSEEQFKGLLADKQAEVKKRQDAEKQIAELQGKLTEALPLKSPAETGGDDRALTVSEFKQLMAEQRKADADSEFNTRQAASTQNAMTEFTAEKCGDGLDFQSVVSAGESNLTEGDLLAIRKAKDPASEKYRRCIMLTDELAGKAETYRTSQMLEKVKLTGRVPATGGADTGVTTDDIGKMSEEQLDQLAESLD